MDELTRWAGRTIGQGSKSFALASRLFDTATRRRVWMLYAWCRHCDDVIDAQEGGQGHRASPVAIDERLAALSAETRDAISGKTITNKAFQCLDEVVRETKMPAGYPAEHIAGFAMDAHDRDYHRIEDTLDYCYHVAGVVGAMMAVVMGVRPDDDAVLARAADLGIAFQLTNIARDIVDDAKLGRCYLPDAWLADAGIPPGDHARPEHRGALASVASRLLDLADEYYASAREGANYLPFRSAWAVLSAAEIYRAIGGKVRAAGAAAWDSRQHTSRLEKFGMVWRSRRDAKSARPDKIPGPRARLWKKGDTPDWKPPASSAG